MSRPWHLDLAMLGVWMMILLDIAVFVRSIVMCYVGVQHIYAVPQKRRKVKSLGRIQTKEKNPVTWTHSSMHYLVLESSL